MEAWSLHQVCPPWVARLAEVSMELSTPVIAGPVTLQWRSSLWCLLMTSIGTTLPWNSSTPSERPLLFEGLLSVSLLLRVDVAVCCCFQGCVHMFNWHVKTATTFPQMGGGGGGLFVVSLRGSYYFTSLFFRCHERMDSISDLAHLMTSVCAIVVRMCWNDYIVLGIAFYNAPKG